MTKQMNFKLDNIQNILIVEQSTLLPRFELHY
jgi:hypothetical protein